MQTFTLDISGGSVSSNATFLAMLHRLIVTFASIHDIIEADYPGIYSDEAKELGLSLEDVVLDAFDNKIAEVSLDTLQDGLSCIRFTQGVLTTKLFQGILRLEPIWETIRRHASLASALPLSTYKEMSLEISYALGDLTYAFCSLTHMRAIGICILESERRQQPLADICKFDQTLQLLFEHLRIQPVTLVQQMLEYQTRFISIIPIFENNPKRWLEMTKDLDPSLLDILLNFGDYVYPIDLRSTEAKIITPEELTERVQQRADTPDYIGTLYPEEWRVFQEHVPDEYLSLVMGLEDQLRIHNIISIVNGAPFDAEYAANLLEAFSIGPSVENTTSEFTEETPNV